MFTFANWYACLYRSNSGRATIAMRAGHPLNAPGRRQYIGSQLDFSGGSWVSDDESSVGGAPIRAKVYTRGSPVESPTWSDDILPILEPYFFIYPYMKNCITLNDYDSVKQNKDRMIATLTAPESSAAHMPVNRDLSAYQRKLILDWYAAGAPE